MSCLYDGEVEDEDQEKFFVVNLVEDVLDSFLNTNKPNKPMYPLTYQRDNEVLRCRMLSLDFVLLVIVCTTRRFL